MDKRIGLGRRFLRAAAEYIKGSYKAMWAVIIIISAYSWILVYSANHRWGSAGRAIYIQLIVIFLGCIAAIFISLMDYERLGELWWLVGGICVFMMLWVIFFGGGARGESSVSENKAWIYIFGISFQSSELLKIGFLVTFSYHLSRVLKENLINNLRQIILLLGHMVVPVGMIMITKDAGSALMFTLMAMVILVSSGINWKYILAGIAVLLAALPVLWNYMAQYQRDRFRVVYTPNLNDPHDVDLLYQQTQGRIAIGSGQLTGQGFLKGQMIQKGLVPECSNDFILTVAGNEFGFLGCLLIIVLLVALMIFCIRTALQARDDMGRFICVGFFSLLAIQTIFNIGMCLMILPVIGITLPFFSKGGSSSICLYLGFGLVLSVFSRRNETQMKILL